MLLLGLPPLAQIISDELWVTLALSAVRGLGFGILTVTGTAAVAVLKTSSIHRLDEETVG